MSTVHVRPHASAQVGDSLAAPSFQRVVICGDRVAFHFALA